MKNQIIHPDNRAINQVVPSLIGQTLTDWFHSRMPKMELQWLFGPALQPYFSQGNVTIFHGDCQKILAHLPAAIFDLVLTDPPYGIKLNTERKRRGRGGRDYRRIIGDDRIFDPSHLLHFKHLILWGANYYAQNLPRSTKWLIWDKREGRGQNNQSDCEVAWTKGLSGVATRCFYHMWNGACRASERGEKRDHPTQKPIDLMKWCLSLFPHAKIILDPYMGVGTTLLAAQRLGLQAVGIEIDERYCEIAAKRLAI